MESPTVTRTRCDITATVLAKKRYHVEDELETGTAGLDTVHPYSVPGLQLGSDEPSRIRRACNLTRLSLRWQAYFIVEPPYSPTLIYGANARIEIWCDRGSHYGSAITDARGFYEDDIPATRTHLRWPKYDQNRGPVLVSSQDVHIPVTNMVWGDQAFLFSITNPSGLSRIGASDKPIHILGPAVTGYDSFPVEIKQVYGGPLKTDISHNHLYVLFIGDPGMVVQFSLEVQYDDD